MDFSSGTRIFVKWLFAFLTLSTGIHWKVIWIDVNEMDSSERRKETNEEKEEEEDDKIQMKNDFIFRWMGIFHAYQTTIQKTKIQLVIFGRTY